MTMHRRPIWLLAAGVALLGCDANRLLDLERDTLVGPPPPALSSSEAPAYGQFNATATGHDWANAYLLAYVSHYMYPASLEATEAEFEAEFEAHFAPLGLDNFRYIKNPLTDTEAMVAETDDAVIIAFRGTESPPHVSEPTDLIDLLVDITVLPITDTHAGFLTAALSVLPQVQEAIILSGNKRVWITGHSLGGALATVTAFLLETTSPHHDVQGVYTYGAPRVFFDTRATLFNTRFGGRAQRWANHLDPIPHMPHHTPHILVGPGLPNISWPYTHTRVLNNIKPDGGSCTIVRNDDEMILHTQDEIDAFTMTLGLAGLPILAIDAFLRGDLDDHDIAKYASRIYARMPASLRALMQTPPFPSGSSNACDGPQDVTPPEITVVVEGTEGENGWYVSDVRIRWTVRDPESPITSESGCFPTEITSDTPGETLTCTATSQGGTNSLSVTIRRDATPPTNVVVAAERAPDHDGWYNAPFTATWSGEDATSGIASCTVTEYAGPDTGDGLVSGTCTDEAGNTSEPVALEFRYDATPPVITIAIPGPGTPDYFRDQSVASSYTCADATSGVASCEGPVPSGADIDTGSFGTNEFTVEAFDQAGNRATLSRPYTVTYAFDGFYAPVIGLPAANVLRAGQSFPFKWNLMDAGGSPVAGAPELFTAGWTDRFTCGGDDSQSIEYESTAGQSGLRWDDDEGQYVFVASSSRGDAGYCRYLVVKVGESTDARALVRFRR